VLALLGDWELVLGAGCAAGAWVVDVVFCEKANVALQITKAARSVFIP
jgi:hypothetical protein